MIELRNVSKGFKGIELFRDVSLCIPDGKKIFIKGTNGSGKSVLLKMIIGFSRPDSGQILVNGEEVGKSRISSRMPASASMRRKLWEKSADKRI